MSGVHAGDLAIVQNSTAKFNGRIVEVTEAAPPRRFQLPDGRWCGAPQKHPSWIIKFIGGAARVPIKGGESVLTSYCVARADQLRPPPGDPDTIDERYTSEVTA
jgi:hypothetical protein